MRWQFIIYNNLAIYEMWWLRSMAKAHFQQFIKRDCTPIFRIQTEPLNNVIFRVLIKAPKRGNDDE